MPLTILKEQKEIRYNWVTCSGPLARVILSVFVFYPAQEVKMHCFALLLLTRCAILFVIPSFYPHCFKELAEDFHEGQNETCLALLLPATALNAAPDKNPQ